MLANKSKICFVGQSGVGKTSLLSLLQGRMVPLERDPTVGLEIENSTLNGKKCAIWDFGGQERFKFMWQDFLRGAGLTVLITDSTEENVERTKEIYERFSNHFASKVIAIANKQDLPNALNVKQVEQKLGGIKTYGMTAINPEYREKMKKLLQSQLKS